MSRPAGKPKTGGRKKGTPNKVTASVKEAIIAAFDQAGGVEYLVSVAKESPAVFCQLVGKVLPLQLTGDAENPVSVRHVFEWEADKKPGA